MKHFLPILFFLICVNSFAQTTIPNTSGNGKEKKTPAPKAVASKPVKKIEYWDEQKKHKKSEEFLVNGKLEGKCYYYFKDGKMDHNGAYKNGLQDSVWTYYYEEGTKKGQETYFEGKKSGPASYWYKNGNSYMSGKFIENLADSVWTTYYESGKIKSSEQYQIQFINYQWLSKKNGHFQYWQENGKPESDGYFVNDTLNGNFMEWYPNGNKKAEGAYAKGKKSGRWNEFFENGKPLEEIEYKDSTEYLWNLWADDGKQVIRNGYGKMILTYD
ncbi:MAG TPA: hypothetical protein VFJ43_17775, partial [Bacteroidia bacterium]|nr:hypothetical protein [Bacteroidia bacterium]